MVTEQREGILRHCIDAVHRTSHISGFGDILKYILAARSIRIGDNTDLAIGAYLEYDPIGYSPAKTNNLSLMEWNYSIDDHTNEPVYRRDYTSVLEANRAPQNRDEGEAITGAQLVRKYNRTSVGLRVSVSLLNVPLEFGKNYRKQQLYKVCMCDFF